MKKYILCLLAGLLMIGTGNSAYGANSTIGAAQAAETNSGEEFVQRALAVKPAPGPTYTKAQLAQAYNYASAMLNEAEAMVKADSDAEAYRLVVSVLREIKIKLGQNENKPFEQIFKVHIPVGGVISKADLKLPFASLKNHQRENLADAIYNYMGGTFMDLLNMVKRLRVLKVEAFYDMTHADSLMRDDQRMLDDLKAAHDIALFVANPALAPDTYMLFDLDIADPDMAYFFNREIVQLALKYEKRLGQTESSFQSELDASKLSRLQSHWRGMVAYQPAKPVVAQPSTSNWNACLRHFSNYNAYDSSNYCQRFSKKANYATNSKLKKCLSHYNNYNAYDSSYYCIEKGHMSNF